MSSKGTQKRPRASSWAVGTRLKHVRDGTTKTGFGRLHCFYRTTVSPLFEPYRGWRGPRCPKCHRPGDRFWGWEEWEYIRERHAREQARRRERRERQRLARWRLG